MQSGLFIFELQESNSNIEEEVSSNIFPNPFSNYINITSISNTAKTIRIYDVFGKEIVSKKTNEKETTIPLNELSQGMYIVKINSKNTTIEKRIIKY
jgi:hypothetical protein